MYPITRFSYAFLVAVIIAVLAVAVSFIQSQGIDLYVLWTAGREFVSGANPYSMELKFYTPVWSLAVLAPLSLLSFSFAGIVWSFLSMAIWLAVLRTLRVGLLESAVFLLNPFFIYGMILGSYDWLALVGLLMPMQSGVWFLLLKPQATLGYLFWHMNENGVMQALKDYWLAGLVLAFSIALGYYRTVRLSEMFWNTSVGIAGIPIGLYLMWCSFKKRDALYALAAAPFLSPYVAIQTWAIAMLLLTRNRWALAGGVALGWVVVLARIA